MYSTHMSRELTGPLDSDTRVSSALAVSAPVPSACGLAYSVLGEYSRAIQ